MSDKIFAKVEVEHAADCHAMQAVKRGDWPDPWSGLLEDGREYEFLRKDGRRGRGGHTLFLRVKCNATNCAARLLVRAHDVTRIAHRSVRHG